MAVEMVVQKLVALVRYSGVTILAGPTPFGHRQSEAATGDLVVSGFVTIMTLESKAAHVDIAAAGVEIKKRIELTVPDRILAGICEMAGTTGLPTGLAHILGHMDQVHVGIRFTRAQGRFLVSPRGVMADEAVDPGLVGEVKVSVLPAIAGMTTGATGPVAGKGYEEVIDGFVGLAQVDLLLVILGEGRRASPQPVGTGKHLLGLNIVTAKTLFYHFGRSRFPGKLDQLVMIRDILWVAFGAPHRSLVPFLVTAHALPVVCAFEPDSPEQLRVEGFLVTRGTPGDFSELGINRPVVMTNEAILEKPGVFLVHKPHRPVEILLLSDDRVVQKEVGVLHVLQCGQFIAVEPSQQTAGRPFFGEPPRLG
jgi:hypothetical protein